MVNSLIQIYIKHLIRCMSNKYARVCLPAYFLPSVINFYLFLILANQEHESGIKTEYISDAITHINYMTWFSTSAEITTVT